MSRYYKDFKELKTVIDLLYNDDESIGVRAPRYVAGRKAKTYDCAVYTRKALVNDAWEALVVNPVASWVNLESVTCFRNFRFEIDPSIKTEEFINLNSEIRDQELRRQESLIRGTGLPFSAIIYSGGKSLHVVVALESGLSKEVYDLNARWVQAIIPEFDHQSLNGVTGIRLPGHMRESTGL